MSHVSRVSRLSLTSVLGLAPSLALATGSPPVAMLGVTTAPPYDLSCDLVSDTGRTHHFLASAAGGVDQALVRTFHLSDGTWTVTCGLGVKRDKTDWRFTRQAWTVTSGALDPATPASLVVGVPDAKVANMYPQTVVWLRLSAEAPEREAPASSVVRTRMLDRLAVAGDGKAKELGDVRFVNEQVSESAEAVLRLVADVAYEEAQDRSYQAVSARLERLLCTQIVSSGDKLITFNSAWPPPADLAPVFAESCDVVKAHSVPELMSTDSLLQDALGQDLVVLAVKALRQHLPEGGTSSDPLKRARRHVENIAVDLAPVLTDLVTADGQPDDQVLRSVLAVFIGQDWMQAPLTSKTGGAELAVDPSSAECGVAVALAVADTCLEGTCTLADVDAMLADPGSVLALPDCKTAAGGSFDAWLAEHRGTLADLATELVDLVQELQTTSDSTDQARARTRDAVVLLFDALDLALSSASSTQARTLVADFERLVLALLDASAAKAVAAGGVLVSDLLAEGCASAAKVDEQGCRKAQRKVAQVVPLVTVLATAANEEPAEDEEAAYEARKEELKAAIRAATVRDDRGGEVVFSAGVNVGARAHAPAADMTNWQASLSLPTGIALDLLPMGRDVDGKVRPLGLHLQLSALDLGQLASTDVADETLYWNDFLMIGGQAGLLIGDEDTGFVVGPDLRYRPTGSDQGELQLGGSLTWYVPFVDFN